MTAMNITVTTIQSRWYHRYLWSIPRYQPSACDCFTLSSHSLDSCKYWLISVENVRARRVNQRRFIRVFAIISEGVASSMAFHAWSCSWEKETMLMLGTLELSNTQHTLTYLYTRTCALSNTHNHIHIHTHTALTHTYTHSIHTHTQTAYTQTHTQHTHIHTAYTHTQHTPTHSIHSNTLSLTSSHGLADPQTCRGFIPLKLAIAWRKTAGNSTCTVEIL